MAYIRTIPEAQATDELAEAYKCAGNPDGTVDNVMKVHSLNVDSLRTHFAMYTAAMHKPSPISRA
ncbi:MAG: peroxidase-related enzyme, partial [Planctomycetota bacterium]|nr:peroxidase-related enzyme [Planctomycetota bacterium]